MDPVLSGRLNETRHGCTGGCMYFSVNIVCTCFWDHKSGWRSFLRKRELLTNLWTNFRRENSLSLFLFHAITRPRSRNAYSASRRSSSDGFFAATNDLHEYPHRAPAFSASYFFAVPRKAYLAELATRIYPALDPPYHRDRKNAEEHFRNCQSAIAFALLQKKTEKIYSSSSRTINFLRSKCNNFFEEINSQSAVKGLISRESARIENPSEGCMQIFESTSCVARRTNFDDYLASPCNGRKKKKKKRRIICMHCSERGFCVRFFSRWNSCVSKRGSIWFDEAECSIDD